MQKISPSLNFCMNHLFVSIIHGMPKRLPNIIFAFSIRHVSRAGNMGSKIITSVNRVDFGDDPY